MVQGEDSDVSFEKVKLDLGFVESLTNRRGKIRTHYANLSSESDYSRIYASMKAAGFVCVGGEIDWESHGIVFHGLCPHFDVIGEGVESPFYNLILHIETEDGSNDMYLVEVERVA